MNFESNSDNYTRSRSNTWPRIQMENAGFSAPRNQPQQEQVQGTKSSKKAFTGRRNICGILSYADLITQAITSSPNQQLSLAQIYQWIENAEIFKGQVENSESWKNSIRHNLSLHNKFVRIPATGNAKGSLWTVDPNAKPTKLARKRFSSVSTSKKEEKMNPVNKADQPPNDFNLPGYQRHTDSRFRMDSNGSTYSKLSPIRSEESLTTLVPAPNVEYTNYYSGYRERAYSNGSSCGQTLPYWVDSSRCFSTSSSGGTMSQEIDQQAIKDMFNNFEQGLNMHQYAPNYYSSYLPQGTNTAENSFLYQYPVDATPLALQRPQTFETRHESSVDIDNIEVETMRTPLQCDVDEIVRQELNIEGVLDFDF